MKTYIQRTRELAAAGAIAIVLVACGPAAPPEAPAPEQEWVSIGYGTRSPDQVTGSVSSLAPEDIDADHVRIEDMLEGRIPGLIVQRRGNGAFALRIRGNGSIHGNKEPLVVIDGMPLHSRSAGFALAALVPSDVARIDVLKDGYTGAMYGSRGANGVIVITTKRR